MSSECFSLTFSCYLNYKLELNGQKKKFKIKIIKKKGNIAWVNRSLNVSQRKVVVEGSLARLGSCLRQVSNRTFSGNQRYLVARIDYIQDDLRFSLLYQKPNRIPLKQNRFLSLLEKILSQRFRT